jgi:hypothetical protein
MPAFDLSTANLGRVAGQTVDKLRIANQDVWSAVTTSLVYDTVFNNVPNPIKGYNDLGQGSWLLSQFELLPGKSGKIYEFGMNFPSDWLSYYDFDFGFQFYVDGMLRTNDAWPVALDYQFSESRTVVAGWNWFTLPTPIVWDQTKPFVGACYKFPPNYLYNDSNNPGYITSTNGNFYLVERGNANNPGRSWFQANSSPFWKVTESLSYGIDLRFVPDA